MQKLFFIVSILCFISCGGDTNTGIEVPPAPPFPTPIEEDPEENNNTNIDLSHWKVTLPIPRSDTDTRPLEIEPPEILDYPNLVELQSFMFDDTEEGALVFYTEPGVTTTNSSYSRTELREQMVPGSNSTNWTFAQGGIMQGKLRVSDVSGAIGNHDRLIVMQIHGRLTNEQRDLIGASDNNAPPVVKVYWDNGKINFRRKVLVDEAVDDVNILHKESWTDESHWFSTEVGNEPFEIKITASDNYLKCEMIGTDEVFEFSDIHTEKWGVFENYFKAGNYLISTNTDAFSEVKYYSLSVIH